MVENGQVVVRRSTTSPCPTTTASSTVARRPLGLVTMKEALEDPARLSCSTSDSSTGQRHETQNKPLCAPVLLSSLWSIKKDFKMSKQFDVLVVAAAPAAMSPPSVQQLGFRRLREVNPYADPKGEAASGGTCLNVGCIPFEGAAAYLAHVRGGGT